MTWLRRDSWVPHPPTRTYPHLWVVSFLNMELAKADIEATHPNENVEIVRPMQPVFGLRVLSVNDRWVHPDTKAHPRYREFCETYYAMWVVPSRRNDD